ncbi:hypothetical protein EsH8_III_001379 [Colletotrichum jinshuiense]
MANEDKDSRNGRKSGSKRDAHSQKGKARTGSGSSSSSRGHKQQPMRPESYQPSQHPSTHMPVPSGVPMRIPTQSGYAGSYQQPELNFQPIHGAGSDTWNWASWPSEPGSYGFSEEDPNLVTQSDERERRRQYAINHPGAQAPPTERVNHLEQLNDVDVLGLGNQGYSIRTMYNPEITLDEFDEPSNSRRGSSPRRRSSGGHRHHHHHRH